MLGPLGPRCAAAVLVALTLVAGGCAAGGDETESATVEELATAGSGSGTLLAYGVVRSAGEPVEGATVVLQANPVGSAGFEGPERRWSTPAVSTDENGTWALRVDPEDIPEEYLPTSHSFLEFDLVFGDGARLTLWKGTTFLRSDPPLWRTRGANPDDAVLRLEVDLDSGDIVATDSVGDKLPSGD